VRCGQFRDRACEEAGDSISADDGTEYHTS
jgi:hypothetical protein